MEKYIPYEKLSKKKKRELDAKRRTVWAISPVTRKPVNSKAYQRKKAQKWNDDSSFCAFSYIQGVRGASVARRQQRFDFGPRRHAAQRAFSGGHQITGRI
jgi:hypothetical protein